jgi:hypothetical protein
VPQEPVVVAAGDDGSVVAGELVVSAGVVGAGVVSAGVVSAGVVVAESDVVAVAVVLAVVVGVGQEVGATSAGVVVLVGRPPEPALSGEPAPGTAAVMSPAGVVTGVPRATATTGPTPERRTSPVVGATPEGGTGVVLAGALVGDVGTVGSAGADVSEEPASGAVRSCTAAAGAAR